MRRVKKIVESARTALDYFGSRYRAQMRRNGFLCSGRDNIRGLQQKPSFTIVKALLTSTFFSPIIIMYRRNQSHIGEDHGTIRELARRICGRKYIHSPRKKS
jgi:hypothetical protein